MRNTWTIVLNVLARIGNATQSAIRAKRDAVRMLSATVRMLSHIVMRALRAILICALAVAMWLPMCLTADTAIAASTAKNSIHSAIKHAATKHAATKRSETAPAPVSGGSLMQPAPSPVFVNGDDNVFARFQNGGGISVARIVLPIAVMRRVRMILGVLLTVL